jgi:hypothetical protein
MLADYDTIRVFGLAHQESRARERLRTCASVLPLSFISTGNSF